MSYPDTEAPAIVTGVVIGDVTHEQVVLSWTATTDDVGVERYLIMRDGSLLATTTASTTYVDASVAPSATYAYSVVAEDTSGNASEPSGQIAVTTQAEPVIDTTPPSLPAQLTATAQSATVALLRWQANPADSIERYSVYRSQGSAEPVLAGSIDCTDTDCSGQVTFGNADLQPLTTYGFAVYATGQNGVESEAANATVTLPELIVDEFRGAPNYFQVEHMTFNGAVELVSDESAAGGSALRAVAGTAKIRFDFTAAVRGGGHLNWIRVKTEPGFDDTQTFSYVARGYGYRAHLAGFGVNDQEWTWIPIAAAPGATTPLGFYAGSARDVPVIFRNLPDGLQVDQVYISRSYSDVPG